MAVVSSQALPQPVRQVGLHRRWKRAVLRRLDPGGERCVLVLERPAGQAEDPYQRGDRERMRRGAAGSRFQGALAAQHREHGLGDEGAVLLAQVAMTAKVGGQGLVRGARKCQQFRERDFGVRQQRGSRPHVRVLRPGLT